MLDAVKKLFSLFDIKDKKMFSFLMLLLFLSAGLSLLSIGSIIPFISVVMTPDNNWFNHIVTGEKQKFVLFACAGSIIIAFWLKNIIAHYCLRKQAAVLYEIAHKLSRRLFKIYMESPYVWHLSKSTPELIKNISNECTILATGMLAPMGNFVTELVTTILIFCFLLYLNTNFTLIVGCSLVMCMFIFIRMNRNKVKTYALTRTKKWTMMTRNLMQGVGGIKETKLYNLEEYFVKDFNKNNYDYFESVVFSTIHSQSSRFVLETAAVTLVMLAVCLLWTIEQNSKQLFILLAVFAASVMQLLPSLNRLMTAFASIKYSLPALISIHEALTEENKTQSTFISKHPDKDEQIEFKNEITLQNVFFHYPQGPQVLSNINMTIKKGQSIALVGYSGSGKTTLADVILGLHHIEGGRILIDGMELNDKTLKSWQHQLGYVPQHIYSYDCSIRENVAFGVALEDIDDSLVWKALDIACLSDFVRSLPAGLETQTGENGMRLSGGQRQRICIARALFRNPSILIMDEATAALDNETEKEVTRAIQKASEDRTTITIAHRLSTVKSSDVIYVIDQGRITAFGSYEELIGTCDLFSRLVRIDEVA